MGAVSYLLCAATSFVCACLLLRKSSSALLVWGGVCFLALAVENVLAYVDVILLPPAIDISAWRALVAAIGLAAFLWGLIWQTVQESPR